MPSPLAHGSLVWLVRAFSQRHGRLWAAVGERPLFFYVAVVVTLWAPDGDFVLNALVSRPAFAHGAALHSLSAGMLFGLGFAVACRFHYGTKLPVVPVFGVGVACAWSHAIMDVATWGRGVMLLWPFTDERIVSVPLFVGVHRSEPLSSLLHVATVVTELLFCFVVWLIARKTRRPESATIRAQPTEAS